MQFSSKTQAPFCKYSGAGNDFILFELSAIPEEVDGEWIRFACDRQRGIGADGVLFCGELGPEKFWLRIFNCDASKAAMCGNGLRCAAHYLARSRKFDPLKTMQLHLAHSVHEAHLNREWVPTVEIHLASCEQAVTVQSGAHTFAGHLIDSGVPHFVIAVADIRPGDWDLSTIPLAIWGPQLRHHAHWASVGYPEGVNVTLVKPQKDFLAIRTFERGVEEETLACGTGAAAAAWTIGHLVRKETSCTVVFPSGQRAQMHRTEGMGKKRQLWQSGPAACPFAGVTLAPFRALTRVDASQRHLFS